MRFYSILILIQLSFAYVKAQEKEYIVTTENDTIYGKIIRATKHLNPSKVVYKIKDEQGKKYLINPSEVKTIRSINGVDGNCVIKTIYDKFFIKEIIDGRIKVFQSIESVIFYLSKDEEEIMLADFGGFGSRKKAHSQIRNLVKDNPQILKEFDLLKGSEKNILYIIKKYNESYNTITNKQYN